MKEEPSRVTVGIPLVHEGKDVKKTTVERFEDLAWRVREPHSYEVPQIVAVAPVVGTAGYLDWIRRETAPRPGA